MRIIQAAEVGDFSDFIHTPDDEVDVVQGSWRHGGGRFSTFAVATCIALAARNEYTRRGLIGHFSSISPISMRNPQLMHEQFDVRIFRQAVDYIPRLGPHAATTIWLGGAALYAEDSSATRFSKLADRQYAELQISKMIARTAIFDDALKIDWNTTENDLYIRLDTDLGELTVQPIAEE